MDDIEKKVQSFLSAVKEPTNVPTTIPIFAGEGCEDRDATAVFGTGGKGQVQSHVEASSKDSEGSGTGGDEPDSHAERTSEGVHSDDVIVAQISNVSGTATAR